MAPKGRSAFSLLELLVALVFMGLLLGGMFRIYLAGLESWARVNQGLTAQRALRWAMDRIAEDLRMMGYLFPPPEYRTLGLAAGADPALQGGFMLVPGRCDGQTEDQLSFVMDPPPLQAELGGAIAAGGPGEAGAPTLILLRPARALGLEAGDLLVVAGEHCEFVRVAQPEPLVPGRTGLVRVVRCDGAAGPAFHHPHGAGALVQVVRALRVVRYAVVRLPREPGRKARDASGVPCLVRFEAAYAGNRAAPRWDRMLEAHHGREGSHEVVAENVACFRVDFSPDGRFPGIRGADDAAIVGNLNARAQAADPLWFRKAGGLIQVRLELRAPRPGSADPRGEPRRGQTLLIAPRNFGL
jgi:hypothetical protein